MHLIWILNQVVWSPTDPSPSPWWGLSRRLPPHNLDGQHPPTSPLLSRFHPCLDLASPPLPLSSLSRSRLSSSPSVLATYNLFLVPYTPPYYSSSGFELHILALTSFYFGITFSNPLSPCSCSLVWTPTHTILPSLGSAPYYLAHPRPTFDFQFTFTFNCTPSLLPSEFYCWRSFSIAPWPTTLAYLRSFVLRDMPCCSMSRKWYEDQKQGCTTVHPKPWDGPRLHNVCLTLT